MDAWSALASAGVWLALPATGMACLVGVWSRRLRRWTPLSAWGLAGAVGLAVWSLPLLVLAELGLYRSWAVGLAGWGTVLFLWLRRSRGRAALRPTLRWDRWEVALAVGLLVVAALLWLFPTESLLGGVDQGVYSNVGVFLERQGHLHIPLPSQGLDDGAPAFEDMPGFSTQRPDEAGVGPT